MTGAKITSGACNPQQVRQQCNNKSPSKEMNEKMLKRILYALQLPASIILLCIDHDDKPKRKIGGTMAPSQGHIEFSLKNQDMFRDESRSTIKHLDLHDCAQQLPGDRKTSIHDSDCRSFECIDIIRYHTCQDHHRDFCCRTKTVFFGVPLSRCVHELACVRNSTAERSMDAPENLLAQQIHPTPTRRQKPSSRSRKSS